MQTIVLIRTRSAAPHKTPPLGIGYLLKALKDVDGVKRVFIDQQLTQITDDVLLEQIAALNPMVVGFQVFSAQYAGVRRMISKVRAVCPQAKIVAGGPHVSALPQRTLAENADLDFAIRGEGEEALRQLAIGLLGGNFEANLTRIPNLVYRVGNEVVANGLEFVDVNKYGAPDWDMLEPCEYPAFQHSIFYKGKRVAPILTSRGCPFPCTFCGGHLSTGKTIRLRHIHSVVDEIEFLQSKYGIEEFFIEDENFTFYKEHVINFSNEIEKRGIKCHFSFPNGVRLDRIDQEVAYYMRRMGTYLVSFGIESGSKKTLKDMKKEWSLEEVKTKVRLMQKAGVTVNGFFILGFSTETMEDVEKTIKFSIQSGVSTAMFGHYIPLPGTADFDRLVKNGEINLETMNWDSCSSHYYSNSGGSPYHPPQISEKDMLKAVRLAIFRFYFRPVAILNLLRASFFPWGKMIRSFLIWFWPARKTRALVSEKRRS